MAPYGVSFWNGYINTPCCCTLAGTNACLNCVNRKIDIYENQHIPQPIQEKLRVWECPHCHTFYTELTVSCDCKKKSKSKR